MSAIAELRDFRKQGPPGDVGTFIQPATSVVFQFTFSGTTTIVAMAVGVSGWGLIDQGAVVATVINAALAAVGGAVDGEVVILEGAYAVLATLNVPENVLFRGVGWGTLFNYNAGGNCITITGDNVKLRDFKVVIVAGAGEALTRPNCISADTQTNLEITKVWLVGDLTVADEADATLQTGILFTTVTNSRVADSRIENQIRAGVTLTTSADQNTVIGNTITDSGRDIALNDAEYNLVECNVLQGGTYCIALYPASFYNSVVGNSCRGAVSNGMLVYQADNNTVTGNTCTENTEYGIWVYDADNNTVTGNTCNGNGDDGIRLETAINNTVTGNTCNGNTGDGIALTSSNDNTLTGNTCQGSTGASGIALVSSIDNTITGNTCQGNNTQGIRFNGATGNVVSGNSCRGNTLRGMELTASSDNNTIVGNAFNENLSEGLRLYISDFNLIVGNTCYRNERNGISIQTSSNNTIVGNTCNENDYLNSATYDGICIADDADYNWVMGNTCNDNDRWGISIGIAADDCVGNWVKNNQLRGNTSGPFSDQGTDTKLETIPLFIVTHNCAVETQDGPTLAIAAEWVSFVGQLPLSVQQVMKFEIWAVSNQADADAMRLQIEIEGGADNEPKNTHDTGLLAGRLSVTTNFAAEDIIHWECTDVGALALLGGDSVKCVCSHSAIAAPNIATDADFRRVLVHVV